MKTIPAAPKRHGMWSALIALVEALTDLVRAKAKGLEPEEVEDWKER